MLEKYDLTIQILNTSSSNSVWGLLARLLDRSPQKRSTAQDVLEHPCLRDAQIPLLRTHAAEVSGYLSRKRAADDD